MLISVCNGEVTDACQAAVEVCDPPGPRGAAAGTWCQRRMLLESPAHLRGGGLAQFLGNWEDRADQPWTDRLGGWVEQAGGALTRAPAGADVLDAWVG